MGLQGETRGSDRRALERQIASKKIEARKGSRASHKEGDYGVFTPLLLMSRQVKEGKPSCLHLPV